MFDIPTNPAVFAAVPASLAQREHLLLVRHLARLQQQMTVLVRSHETQLRHWQRQLMRQSVRLMLERTRVDWGLGPRAPQAGTARPVAPVSVAAPVDPCLAQTLASAQTDALICHTGCQMDGDHWRDGELCKRNGRACTVDAPTTDEFDI